MQRGIWPAVLGCTAASSSAEQISWGKHGSEYAAGAPCAPIYTCSTAFYSACLALLSQTSLVAVVAVQCRQSFCWLQMGQYGSGPQRGPMGQSLMGGLSNVAQRGMPSNAGLSQAALQRQAGGGVNISGLGGAPGCLSLLLLLCLP